MSHGRHAPGPALSRRAFAQGTTRVLAMGLMPTTAAAEADPSDLAHALDARVAAGEVPGLVALVDDGRRPWTHVAGLRDLASGAPMRRDTIFAVASIGRPLTATAAMILVEEGVLELDAPVEPWLPELADRRVLRSLDSDLDDTVPSTRPITLRDLLTMRMGLGAIFADPAQVPLAERMMELEVAPGPRIFGHSPDEFMRRLGGLPLAHQPGEGWLYHTGMDVAGVLIARAAGTSLGAFQKSRILEPLGMADTGFFVPPAKADRLATCYLRDPETGEMTVWNPASGDSFKEPPPFESGGGGQVSTVDDFNRFGRMLLNRGTSDGRRILSQASVETMLTDQIPEAVKARTPFFPGFWEQHGWGLGIAVVTEPDAISPDPGRFGWWGGFGTTFFADPATDAVALLFSQRMMNGADDTEIGEDFLARAFAMIREG